MLDACIESCLVRFLECGHARTFQVDSVQLIVAFSFSLTT